MPATVPASTANVAGSFINDAGRRCSRRVASRAPAPAPTPAVNATSAAPRPRARATGPASRAAPANAGSKRKCGAGNGEAEQEQEKPAKKVKGSDKTTKKDDASKKDDVPKKDDAPKKRKRGTADEAEKEEDEEERPRKRRTGKEGGQKEGKDSACNKRKRASEEDEEDEEKECPKKRNTAGKQMSKAAGTKKTTTTKKATTTKKPSATRKGTAAKRTKTTQNTQSITTPTACLDQRAPETRDNGEGTSSTPSSTPAQDHTPQPAQNPTSHPTASTSRPKTPRRRLTSIPPPEAWGPDRTASRPKHPYTTPPPVPRGKYAPAHPTHTPEGLPIRFPQPFNDPIPETIPEQTYEPTLPFPNAEEYGYAPLGQRTRDHALRRQRATFLPPAQQVAPSESTEPSAPPSQPPILSPAPLPPSRRNILIPTPRLPSQPGPDWLIDPTNTRARSPRGSHYRWHERRLHDWIPDWNVMALFSAHQRQKHANYKAFVRGHLTFAKHRPVDETEEAVLYGEYVPYTRQPLRRHEQLVQFGWVKLEGEEEREAERLWEQWRPRLEQPVASTSRLPEASTSRLPEIRVATANEVEHEEVDTAIEKEVEEEVTYVGKGKGRAL
ncbi:uncharacterized protein SCHCODRAFT_02680909 [Schizophyllum commune H4-8]|uniref:Uncharacterized protein n=1 Tax=Schizophyllum commune (strain H4-8 / FGSC 9210) TaxID=578458 RepID=D8QGH0_SCHCM|nr:uncharacterized protein SCHCODRAFT_02680909 [Schizophyllum commune H4-8]KAI5888060.1 hypothetical protein SCHCODRAFT_02680909 [Schizophyllum commune H4-8]